MIVAKSWVVTKNTRVDRKPVFITYFWRGWFLFGLVPLYLENFKTEYNYY